MQKFIKIVKECLYFVPFSIYLVIFSALTLTGYFLLNKAASMPDSSYKDVYTLLLSVSLAASVAILGFGLITTLISFLYFSIKKKQNEINFSIQHAALKDDVLRTQKIKIHIKPILPTILGFLRIRIVYDKDKFSHKFSLVSSQKKINTLSLDAEFNWNLPEIREYQIEKIIVYFEDLFQFFSFAVSIPTSNRFHISPSNQAIKNINANPNKTEDSTIRIEQLKRIDGELINYKNFENNDDVRRIVWKIYAKNKELVVRIPEIMNPYASHIYLYTSFHSHLNITGNEVAETFFLNHYKTMCWSIYKQLIDKGFEVKHMNDQASAPVNLPTKDALTQYAMATSKWQNNTNLKDFLKPKNVSVVVVSSFNDPEELEAFSERLHPNISVLYIPLTEALEQNIYRDWARWLFVENENHDISSYRTQWNLSPLRLKVNENEKRMNEVMKQISQSTII